MHMACCLAEWAGEEIVIASVYCDSRRDIQEDITRIRRLLDQHRGKNILLGGDFNCYHTAWADGGVDRRGEAIINLVEDAGLLVLNAEDSSPTYSATQGESAIDLPPCRTV